MSNNSALKVGFFVTLSALALAGVILFFGELPIGKGNRVEYYAYFENVGGLSKGADVRVAGVKVGKVKDLRFKNGKVEVVLELNGNVPLYRDAVAKIESLGLLGDKYVEVEPGHPWSGKLPPNSVISHTEVPPGFSQMVASISKTASSIDRLALNLNLLLEENRKRLDDLIANLQALTKNLNLLLEENRKNVTLTLENLRETLKVLRKELPQLAENYNRLAKNLNGLIKDSQPYAVKTLKNLALLSEQLNEELPKLVRNLNTAGETLAKNREALSQTLRNIAKITKKIEEGRGTLGKLVNDKSLYVELKRSVKTLGEVSSLVSRTQLHIEAFAQYEGEGDSKAGVNVMLQPDGSKYYLFGIVGDSAGKVTKKTYYENGQPYEVVEKEYKPEFNLQYARIFPDRWFHFGSSFVLRFGIKESTGGVGVDYVYNPKLMFTFDVWDFGREDHPGEELKPNTELGFKYMVYGPFFIKAGGYDLLNRKYRTVFVGGGMSFTDNDLKYLLGGMKLPSF
ncbi:MAG TPA: MCE family protein [Aquifex sp.]|nr:MCE family protein [Aquifex sp.]